MDKHAIDSLTPADENSCEGKKSTVQHRIYKITTTYVDKQTNQLRKIKNFGFMQKYGNSVRVSVELHKRGGKNKWEIICTGTITPTDPGQRYLTRMVASDLFALANFLFSYITIGREANYVSIS